MDDERIMHDVNVDGHTKYVDLDKEKQIKGTPAASRDGFVQHDIENDEEHERDMKEDGQDMMDDEFEDDDYEETRAMNDQNEHALADRKQEKQGAYFFWYILLISLYSAHISRIKALNSNTSGSNFKLHQCVNSLQ